MWSNNILETVGNTPLIKLNAVASHVKATVLAKVEYFILRTIIVDRRSHTLDYIVDIGVITSRRAVAKNLNRFAFGDQL